MVKERVIDRERGGSGDNECQHFCYSRVNVVSRLYLFQWVKYEHLALHTVHVNLVSLMEISELISEYDLFL